jgi:hypothetical protein
MDSNICTCYRLCTLSSNGLRKNQKTAARIARLLSCDVSLSDKQNVCAWGWSVVLGGGVVVDAFVRDCWRNGFHWPVLKHGPRSLTYMRVFEWKTLMRNESKGLPLWRAEVRIVFFWFRPRGARHHRPIVCLQKIWVRAYPLGPERWWTMPEQGEARGNSGGGSQRYWRANRSFDLGIGAKD